MPRARKSEGGLDLTSIVTKEIASHSNLWEKVHDRVAKGEMPPKQTLPADRLHPFLNPLYEELVVIDQEKMRTEGRAQWRRMNRYEYENALRDLFDAPWLQLRDQLPEDGEAERFNKIGGALDISHVQMARYMQTADLAMRLLLPTTTKAPERSVTRYYAREQPSMNRKMRFSEFNRSAERATFPLIDYRADLDVLNKTDIPFTVGSADPDQQAREAIGVVASSYEPIEIRFDRFHAPQSGRYLLRFRGYTFWAGPEKSDKWWRADREDISIGRRPEPVTIYSELPPRQLRRLGQFDFQIEPTVQELAVDLLEGETIQPDAVRLFRSRPPNWHNPLAQKDGMPGVAFQYLEVEGPIIDQWPTQAHQLLLGDLPFEIANDKRVRLAPHVAPEDLEGSLMRFAKAAFRRPVTSEECKPFFKVIASALSQKVDAFDALLAGYTAVLCSPDFLGLDATPGPLNDLEVAKRLSLFLWNTIPDDGLLQQTQNKRLQDSAVIQQEVDRMLRDERSRRFIDAFLAYWLDLRRINDTSPDAELYPDYYLDDALVDSALEETQMFFERLIKDNLPTRTLIHSDFAILNERLGQHYGVKTDMSCQMRILPLPPESPRGGILTQASVLKVTANGTTTSPVVRGAWMMERILGQKPPAPPPSVPAIEPDTRGATTVRQQLELHRKIESCNQCHAKIDPIGFALESFDVLGGWQDRYRSLGTEGEKTDGYGKNGQPLAFRKNQPVDASGNLEDGREFRDIRELKQLLLKDERLIARNLLKQLLIYATGSPIRFGDRPRSKGSWMSSSLRDIPYAR